MRPSSRPARSRADGCHPLARLEHAGHLAEQQLGVHHGVHPAIATRQDDHVVGVGKLVVEHRIAAEDGLVAASDVEGPKAHEIAGQLGTTEDVGDGEGLALFATRCGDNGNALHDGSLCYAFGRSPS